VSPLEALIDECGAIDLPGNRAGRMFDRTRGAPCEQRRTNHRQQRTASRIDPDCKRDALARRSESRTTRSAPRVSARRLRVEREQHRALEARKLRRSNASTLGV
jgi:hypothetical protein